MSTLFSSFRRWFAASLLSLTIPTVALVPIAVRAAAVHTDRTIVYSTSFRQLNHTLEAPLTGSLHLRVSKDGYVTGFYRNDYELTQFTPVSGGVNGDHISILIGSVAPTRIDGTYRDGEIVGTAFTPDNSIYQFAATNATIEK